MLDFDFKRWGASQVVGAGESEVHPQLPSSRLLRIHETLSQKDIERERTQPGKLEKVTQGCETSLHNVARSSRKEKVKQIFVNARRDWCMCN